MKNSSLRFHHRCSGCCVGCSCCREGDRFAAASMKDVIEEAAKQMKARDGTEVVASFASSSVLAKQIEQGAPAQIFISADLDWMDYVERPMPSTKLRARSLRAMRW